MLYESVKIKVNSIYSFYNILHQCTELGHSICKHTLERFVYYTESSDQGSKYM